MKTKLKINTSPGHCANLVLAAGANVPVMRHTDLLALAVCRPCWPASWCDGLINFICQTLKTVHYEKNY